MRKAVDCKADQHGAIFLIVNRVKINISIITVNKFAARLIGFRFRVSVSAQPLA
jgi:hypothetical protein